MAPQLEIDFPDHVIEMAALLYAAYIKNSEGLNYQGKPCPAWADLTSPIRGHWCVVANTALVAASEPCSPVNTAMFVSLLNELADAWRGVPDHGQVPIGVGEWLQPLLNAVTAIVAPDHEAHRGEPWRVK